MDKYAKIRDDNLKEQARRFSYVIDNYKDIEALIESKRQLQNAFDVVLSNEKDFRDYTIAIKAINKKIRAALVEKDLPANYLEPIYNCPICEDKGFYYEDDVLPIRCSCNNDETFGCTFADFDIDLFSKEIKQGEKISPYDHIGNILAFAKEYCVNFPHNDKKNILFFGESGLGKSFMASCMCSAIKERGFSVVRVNAYSLIEDFKNIHVNDVPYPKDYFNCDFLVIDDIGTEPMYNNITVEYLFRLINDRIESKKSTLFITNQGYDHCVNRYDERLASRMFDKLITTSIAFVGENLRLIKR